MPHTRAKLSIYTTILLSTTVTPWRYTAYSDPDCGFRIQEAAYYSIWTNLTGTTTLDSAEENSCIVLNQIPSTTEIDIVFLDDLGYVEPTEQGTFTTPKSQYLRANATCLIYPGLKCEGDGTELLPKLGAVAETSRCINESLSVQEGEWSMRCKTVVDQKVAS
ncbi:hypothetical protein AC579_5125 [Pseudocercospora musae]|uniref:Secreted LysM effector LysM C-terminal domain-containing protein n=1 Tax=Pseudocercospora musae TaxID=113226 RepID=A0A139IPA6_9PEZI|nr:hypothetical protein AC579_5125 [Pseudocercospora musae]